MRKIINKKVYDTKTAECVANWQNVYDTNDFSFCYEALYRKNNGEFFLYGEGGPFSKYSYSHGNNWSGSEKITPLSVKAAQEWVEHYANEEYEKLFGEIEESGDKIVVNLSIRKSTDELITRLAGEWECSRSEVIDKALSEIVKKDK